VNIAPTANGSGGYDATAASPIGRMFALGARLAF
jgi:iron complex outermembrane receptor protein